MQEEDATALLALHMLDPLSVYLSYRSCEAEEQVWTVDLPVMFVQPF